MIKLLLLLLPHKYKVLMDVGLKLFSRLDTDKERDAVATFLWESLASRGYLSVTEWGRLGGEEFLGIIGKPKR